MITFILCGPWSNPSFQARQGDSLLDRSSSARCGDTQTARGRATVWERGQGTIPFAQLIP